MIVLPIVAVPVPQRVLIQIQVLALLLVYDYVLFEISFNRIVSSGLLYGIIYITVMRREHLPVR